MKFASNLLCSLLVAVASTTKFVAAQNIVEAAETTEGLSTLYSLVAAAGLAETLSGEGPFTVFAPTDEAFAKVPAETMAMLGDPANVEALVNVLTYHVVAGNVTSADLEAGSITMVNEAEAEISLDPSPMINDANIVTPDIFVSNGVVHLIDTVLLPPTDDMDTMPAGNTTETETDSETDAETDTTEGNGTGTSPTPEASGAKSFAATTAAGLVAVACATVMFGF